MEPGSSQPRIEQFHRPSPHGFANRAARLVWGAAWWLLFRPSPRPFYGWRRFLLRLFGARIARGARPFPSTRIWAPWNLEMGEYSCLGFGVDCYSVGRVRVGAHSTVSQYSYLCTATHDFEDPDMALVTAPIEIGEQVWVAADVFVGPGVRIGEGAVVGARSSVFKDVEPWTVVAGNPARSIRRRTVREPERARQETR